MLGPTISRPRPHYFHATSRLAETSLIRIWLVSLAVSVSFTGVPTVSHAQPKPAVSDATPRLHNRPPEFRKVFPPDTRPVLTMSGQHVLVVFDVFDPEGDKITVSAAGVPE